MAPTVHYADPDGRDNRDESGLANLQEGIMPETGDIQQLESNLRKEIPDLGTASEIPLSNDGRRRSSRLRGKGALGTTGSGDGSLPVSKQSSGSGKRGRRKKAPVLESVQSIGDSVEELKNEVIVESVSLELATKSADLGASPDGDGILARSVSICGEPTLPHVNGKENAAKVVKLEGVDVLDDSPCDDIDVAESVRPLVDSRGDFCDSNIFENLQNIVILHPEENAIHNEVPSTSKIETEEKIETQVDDLLEANLTKEGNRVEQTRLINVSIEGTGPEKSVDEELVTLSIVQARCEITLQACKILTGHETEPVESDLKEEGASRGSYSTSNVGEDGPKLSGEDGSKLNGNDGEDSSSVTSRDGVEHTTATCEDKDCKATSGDNAGGGVSKLASEASLNDVHMATNSGLLVEETIVVQSRKGISIHSKKPHEDDDQVGSRSSSEAKFSRVSPSKSSMLALSSQVLVNGNDDQQNASSIVRERRAILQTTSEIASQGSGEGEDLLQLGRKSDSLKSVNQEISVRDGGVPSALKVECKAEVRRSLSRHAVGGEDDSSGVTEGDINTTSEKMDESVGINSKAGWVKCDDCRKWRSIPVDLAEKIGETNAYWSCKENPNKKFADCSILQVKSNEEINRELGISESSFCDEDDDVDATCDSRPLYNGIQENGQAVWTLIKRNIFKHRSQKHQDADEAMVCQCAPPKPGEVGCGEDCLNRMLNVECLPQQCPCGSLCTNQQFQKRCYANVELFRCGKKGHGLRALENIPRGSFIIEYVGEVLDMASFEDRQKDYSLNSQKHFYFMTLSANEIIDACSKGNLGRFINHSCEPNCQTEKWMVDGEVCIGLFAIRDLKEGEEITFDYNFVRVGGADAKKCECGASKCRGFIGVDPDTPQNVVDIDSDEGEDPEPIMLHAESDEELDDKIKEGTVKKARMIAVSDSRYEKLGGVKRKFYSGPAKDIERPKRKRRVKTAASSKIGSHAPAPSKLFAGSRFGSRNTYHSDVEGKLGELTYESGGLKRDAAKQYLKLLVLTAASGGTVNGAAACSARDLSMLLEALLKTQKLSLLKDIMNKNGLQMFHNLLKQFRKSFEKRPILRKLLKVLDHLAKNRVLTVEHIYSPPRSGTECFSDTLFDLSRHDDTEVQRMARDFRKLYVPPRPHKPVVNIERPLVKSPLQQASVTHSSPLAIDSPLVGSTANNSAEQTPTLQGGAVEEKAANPPPATRRKRPSRWDTVPDTVTVAAASAAFGIPNSAAAASLHGSVRHLPAVSGSQQVPVSVPSDLSLRVSMSPAPPGIPGRPSGTFPPVHPGGLKHHQALPGHIPVGLPGQRQAIPPGLMHLGVQRVPNSNELPPVSQRPYAGPHPMQVPLQMQSVAVHPGPFAYNRGQPAPSMHAVPPGQWALMQHPMGGPMYAGTQYAPPPPPLPPSVRPSWGHNGPRQSDGFPGHVKTASIEPGESEAAGEPPVPGMSPASLRGSRKSENISSGVPEVAPGSARSGTRVEAPPRSHRDEHGTRVEAPPRSHRDDHGTRVEAPPRSHRDEHGTRVEAPPGSHRDEYGTRVEAPPGSHRDEYGTRVEAPPRSHRDEHGTRVEAPPRSHRDELGTRVEAPPRSLRDEHGTRISGHESNVVNRSRSIPDSRESAQQAYSHPDGTQGRNSHPEGKGQREMSWETPECSSFHHHVSGMIRARVEMKHLVHYKDLEKFCSKLTEVVTRKEIKKYRENKIQGMTKTILRSKLLEKVDAYVDLQIGIYSKLKGGEGQS